MSPFETRARRALLWGALVASGAACVVDVQGRCDTDRECDRGERCLARRCVAGGPGGGVGGSGGGVGGGAGGGSPVCPQGCAPGERCNAGVCVCEACLGCCDASNRCQPGTSDAACGAASGHCVTCDSAIGLSCDGGAGCSCASGTSLCLGRCLGGPGFGCKGPEACCSGSCDPLGQRCQCSSLWQPAAEVSHCCPHLPQGRWWSLDGGRCCIASGSQCDPQAPDACCSGLCEVGPGTNQWSCR